MEAPESGMTQAGKDPTGKQPLRVTDDDRVDFHIAEFQVVKGEVTELLRQTSTILTFAISTAGGILAWLFTHPMSPESFKWARWLPLGVSALLGLLALSYLIRTWDKGDYLQRLEQEFGAKGFGFERGPRKHPWLIVATHLILWGALNGSTLTVAWYWHQNSTDGQALPNTKDSHP
ncbi:MAG TPA: hypothetical protein VEW04_03425 [Allosphingosinicella sp.]|nr:hypothetical protein [Allosphingosinicella sp.]